MDIFIYEEKVEIKKEEITKNKKKHEKNCRCCSSPVSLLNQTARVTLPDLRQRVHTQIDFGVPLTTALTLRIFGFHVLLERL